MIIKATLPLSVNTLNGVFTLNYDCPCGQVMSDDMLRIVMIGFAKLEIRWAIIS